MKLPIFFISCMAVVPANAHDTEALNLFSETFDACMNIEDDSEAADCFRKTKIDKLILVLEQARCQVEAWNAQEKADYYYITGATTCATGWLNYRLYDTNTDNFLISGRTFIEGFAFQIYADMPYYDGEVTMRYSVEQR